MRGPSLLPLARGVSILLSLHFASSCAGGSATGTGTTTPSDQAAGPRDTLVTWEVPTSSPIKGAQIRPENWASAPGNGNVGTLIFDSLGVVLDNPGQGLAAAAVSEVHFVPSFTPKAGSRVRVVHQTRVNGSTSPQASILVRIVAGGQVEQFRLAPDTLGAIDTLLVSRYPLDLPAKGLPVVYMISAARSSTAEAAEAWITTDDVTIQRWSESDTPESPR